MTLGAFLALSGLSQSEFAARIGTTSVSVSRYVTGQRMPRRECLLRIQEVTKGAVTANDFVGAEARAS